jgi:hypothetical protein
VIDNCVPNNDDSCQKPRRKRHWKDYRQKGGDNARASPALSAKLPISPLNAGQSAPSSIGARAKLKPREEARDNDVMRKRVLDPGPLPSEAADKREWLNLQELCEVEVTSEADGYPVESAFRFGAGPGWRAASPGKQRIRLTFDRPQSIQRLRFQFNELEVARTQEFTVRWSGGPGEPLKDIIRQQWNFSPDGSTTETENYLVDLQAVAILELILDPDCGAGQALATLADWRVG